MPPRKHFFDRSNMRDSEFLDNHSAALDQVKQSEFFTPYSDATQKNMEREKEWFEKYSMETFRVEKDKVWGVDDDILSK
jgi:hypothetical protein